MKADVASRRDEAKMEERESLESGWSGDQP